MNKNGDFYHIKMEESVYETGEVQQNKYIHNDEEYRLQYVSEGLSEKFPELRLGGVCYQEFRGHDQPCRNCPLAHKKRKTDMFYNEDQQRWLKNQYR